MEHVFIDTNILIYYFSQDAIKSLGAQKIITSTDWRLVTSTQVLSEFLNIISKKFTNDLKTITSHLDDIKSSFLIIGFDENDLEKALSIQKRYKIAYYDSLIIITALKTNCTILYSEDMHHGLTIEKKLKVVNPFK